jgi:hypothetical protein
VQRAGCDDSCGGRGEGLTLIRWLRVRCELDRMAEKSGVTQQMTLKFY